MEVGRPLILPAAHDAYSARLIAAAGFKAFAIAGSTMLAARYALPDVGIAAFAEMAAAIQDVAAATDLPFIMDGDDGYGDAKNIVHMVRNYERIGIAALILEDQARSIKSPGDNPAPAVVPVAEHERKIRVAAGARSSPELLVIARTDSLSLLGLDEALKRSERYLAAGADGVFIAGLKSDDEFRRTGTAFRGQNLLVVLTEDGKTELPYARDLYAMGFNLIVYPSYLMLRATESMTKALTGLKTSAENARPLDPVGDLAQARTAFQNAVHLQDWLAAGRGN